MGDRLLEELVSAMSAERQEAIARRTAELLDAWSAFEPAPLPPFDTSTVALSWLALARDAVAEIRLEDIRLENIRSENIRLDEIRSADVAPPEEPISDEVIAAPSPDAVAPIEGARTAEALESLTDAAPEIEAAPVIIVGEAEIIALDGEIPIAAAISGGSVENEPVLALVPFTASTDGVAAAAETESEDAAIEEAIALGEAIAVGNDDLAFPMLSPFEGDDASAALARAVSEGLALRTGSKPKTRSSNRGAPMTVHPGALPAYMGPPTSGTRLSSP
ncbi:MULTISPECIES: hypothetical protein [unclassified Chelatococcus]|uniref:hypothetical protein n=1 Tax=unclassified Chelatococcus TaxID=2638111 RepID=UPI001BCABB5C|nr:MULTISPECIES: hypothetical protein [unclassified Chelatococcus]CAH1673279.1 conserved hypothetical protein [Hyphomicrobiales bacterium]MBS7738691.1 hypothetical protein [Chelatococcus sp. HY11]MBX3543095.1 hypothetical protein [Chelatococcus sp.]MCO5076778.1 hypothetical protein [Chelatococcus sp.]CAH1674480.1 conserved hypothetical protein [Hyphomicrobiales bacterium]